MDSAAGDRSVDSAAAVLAILSKLQSLGFCAGLRIPDATAASDPSEAFDAVLATFLREAYAGGREARPIPVALGDGRCVDLLRLFLAVRAAGGYAGVPNTPGGWAAAAESAGVDPALAAPVKLVYAKYLGVLDRWIQRLVEAHGPFLDVDKRKRQEELFVGANGVGEEESLLDCNGMEQRNVMLKRKRGGIVGMLGWMREIAENAGNGVAAAAGSSDEYFSMALAVRKMVTGKRARRESMLNDSLFQEIFPIGCNCCIGPTNVGNCAKAKILNGSVVFTEQENNLAGEGKHETMTRNSSNGWLFTNHQKDEIPVGPNYQVHVPQWTGKVPLNYDDPETLKWLGTKVWPPENESCKTLFCGDPIGKGRDVVCGCNYPGSVECVRFHVAEWRLKLKRELGAAFYAWGFNRMGEEIALSWTDEEEASFKAAAQHSAAASGRNFWNRLHLFFQFKGKKELVSYYFNCFLLRRRCYQNRITPKNIDSDDDEETEFRFLGNRLGHCAAKYHSTKHTICIENTHSMDLDE